MPQQPGHSRFRPEDLTTRPVSSFRDLDAMTMYVDYLLMRIGEQREEVERELVAFEAVERDQRARALREIKDNYNVGFELPHIAAYLSVAAELSVARVSIRCASSAPSGAPCPLGSGLGKMPGAPPCYSPHKSVGTRSGGVPGA